MNRMFKKLLVLAIVLSTNAHAGPGGGDIDTSFSGSGYEVFKFPIGTDDESGNTDEILIDKTGRIYVIGSPLVADSRRFGIARFSPQGEIDNTFGTNGKIVTETGVGNISAAAATFDNQGKILVAGYKRVGATNHDFFVCRFDTNGSLLVFTGSNNACARPEIDLDPDFPIDESFGVAVDDEDRIVLVGEAHGEGESYGAVVRLNPDGSRDQSFDGGTDNAGPGDGIVLIRTASFMQFEQFNAVTVGADGNIYIVGTGADENDLANHRLITVHKLSDTGESVGNFTTTFHDVATDGKNEGNSIALDRNGDIVVAGATNDDAVVLKLSRISGTPVNSFGTAGIKILTNGARFALNDLVVTHDNDIIAVGTYRAALGMGEDQDILALRMNSNGSLDSSFGVNGLRTIDMFEVGEDDYAAAVALTPAGEKPVIAGSFGATDQTFGGHASTLTRLTSDVIFFDSMEIN